MDIFHGRALSPAGPATDIMPVTPNDAADLAITASALFIEIGGIIEIVTVRDETSKKIWSIFMRGSQLQCEAAWF